MSLSDNFIDDYLKQPWKLSPAYHVGHVIHMLVTNQKITPHKAISGIPITGTIAVAVVGERNTDKIIYKNHDDLLSSLSNYIKNHPCNEFLSDLSTVTQFTCQPYAFNFRTMENIEIPFMAACLGLDTGSLLLPIIVDLGTMPLQMVCSEWYNYRIQLYSHLKGVSPDDYEFLLDLPEVDDDFDTIIAYGDNTNNNTNIINERYRRGVLTSAAKPAIRTILKLIRPQKIYNSVVSTYISKSFRGPTGKVLSETTMDAVKTIMRTTEMHKSEAVYKISANKLRDMFSKYFFMPEFVTREIKTGMIKSEKISLVKEAYKKYHPNPFDFEFKKIGIY